MAASTEYEKIEQPWTILKSVEEVNKELTNKENSLVIILFNTKTVERFSIEPALKRLRYKYEQSNKVKFFKCVILSTDDKLATHFKIEKTPTIYFYRKNDQRDSLVKPTEEQLEQTLEKLIGMKDP